MHMLKKALLLLPISLSALQVQPWFHEIYEFTFTPSYTYSRYRDVQNGHPQLKSASNDHLIAFDLGISPMQKWDVDADLEFADTPRQSLGFRSSALQLRYQWLDDIAGDPVSVTTGISGRGVGGHSLKDVSCPYHSYANFELNSAVGKEWDTGPFWFLRTFGFAAVGMANHGFPWMRALIDLEGNLHHTHRLGLFAEGYFGFGDKTRVHVDHFRGYSSLRHQSIDVGLKYTYAFQIWGRLSLAYTRRVFARSFPENVNFFTICYQLPFSLF